MEPKRRPRSTHAAAACRKHPQNRHCPGVCSACLTERLSRLSAAATTSRPANTATSSCSSSSSLSSLSSLSSSEVSSYSSSPVHRHFRRGKIIGVMKSKSVGRGFWSKLLGHRSEKRVDEGLVHSRTMRETTIVH
nr:Protein ovarian tumor locus like [Ipomoea trifida]